MLRPNCRVGVAICLLAMAGRASGQLTLNNPVFGTEGSAYSFQLQASGGIAPYTYTCGETCGALTAAGLSLSASGVISGTPTTVGTVSFAVQVTDSSIPLLSASFSKSIQIGQAPLLITTTSVLPATRGAGYSSSLAATGGSGGYSWSLSPQSNPLPGGLSVSGSAVAGTPLLSDTAGNYAFRVTVRDTLGDTASQSFTLTLNNPAITLSGTPGPGIVGGNYSSAVSASGGSGGPYTYTWTEGRPGGLTLNSSTGVITGTPIGSGTYNFSISVSDGSTFTPTFTPQSYSITIYPAITISPTSIPAGDALSSYSQSFTASGGSGSGYSYAISATPPGMTFSGNTLSGAPSASGTYTFSITARDSLGFTGASATISLAVNSTLTLSPGTLASGQVGTAYPSTTFTASGGAGSYTYSSSGTIPGLSFNSGVLSGTPTQSGKFPFSVTAKDGLGYSTTNSFTVTISNSAITLNGPGSLPAGIANGAYPQQTFTARGGNGGPYTYTMSAVVPGLNFTGGVLSGTPTSANTYNFTISVSDGSQFTPAFTPQNYSITVYPQITIAPTSIPAADANANYSQTFSASGGSGTGYTYTISSPPAGLSLSASGTLSGPPSASGSFNFTITAKDSLGFTGTSGSISLAVNPALTLSPATLTAGQMTIGYSQAFTASGGAAGYVYSLVGTAPPGLSLVSGVLSGTPTASGTFNFSISVKDSLGVTISNAYSLAIANPPIVVQPTTLVSGQVGVSYSQLFTATGGNGGPYTLSIGAPAPFGLNFSGATLSGSPTSYGTSSITISATDGTLTGQRTYSLTVIPAGLTLSPTTILANGIVGVKYNQTFTAVGGLGTYTFSIAPAPPSGLTFSSSGATAALSGTPTVSGSFPLTVTVSDGSSTLPRNYTLAISSPSISITTTSLPAGNLNTTYTASMAVTGGTPPYTWTASGLPPGLSIASNGNITGAPTSAGTFTATFTVTDSSSATAATSLPITVQGTTLTITTTSPLPPALSGKPYSVTFAASGGVPPYSFSISSGNSQLAGSGATLSGTPLNTTGKPVIYNVSVQVRDSAGDQAQGGFALTVQPAAAGIILSAGSLAFTAVSGGPAPQPQYFSASSTTTGNVAFSAGTDSPWLSVTPSGNSLSTPATLQVRVSQTGLLPSTTPYTGNVNVNGPDGQHQVAVSLTVKQGLPQLSVAPTIISFTTDGTSQPGPGSVQISNTGGGTINFTVSLVNGSSWINLGSSPGSVTNTTPVSIPVNAVIGGLAPGVYRDVIEIDSDAGTADVPVTLLVAGGSTINLVPAGALFTSREGQGESDGAQTFQILTTGTSSVNWSASLNGGSGWLTLNTANGTSSAAQQGIVSYTVNPTNLSAGNYYATIHVDAPSATNSPRDFLVVESVAPVSSPAFPLPAPAGLLFVSSPGSPVPAAQTVQVNTSSTSSINFSAAANTYSGGAWLMVAPTNGSASTTTPGQVSVTVNAAGLATGVYQGGVSFTLDGNPTGVRTVNVVLIVTGSSQSPSLVTSMTPKLTADASCSPSKIVALQTGLVSNFSTPAGWPTPLAIQLDDDCGNAVANGSVVASFSNGDAPVALQLTDSKHAVYSATWNPHGASNQVTVTARATAPTLQAITAQIVGAVTPNQVPILYQHGTIHNMNPQAGAPLAPGTIVQIYGSGLNPATQQTALPLPTNVNGTIVLIGGIAAPLYYVSDGQINAELPLELTAGRQYQIIVSANGALTLPDTLDIEPVTPGVAAMTTGQFIAQHGDGSYVTASSPAQPGEVLTIYLAGMGLTDQSLTTGQVSPLTPLAHPLIAPSVTVNGEPAQITFAGLTPQAVGLYQINFTVPSDAAAGNATIVVSQGMVLSNSGTLPVQ